MSFIARWPLLAVGLLSLVVTWPSKADEAPSAKVVPLDGYTEAIELKQGNLRAVLCPQAGGRVLEFSVGGKQALFLDDVEKEWKPGAKTPLTAGRFDVGPELTVAPHPTIWGGEWTAEIVDHSTARLTSPRDEAAGFQVIREFEIFPLDTEDEEAARLECRQTIYNISDRVLEVCHWGRSFSPGGGIALVPLGDEPSRFPAKYAMYEDSAIINVRNSDDKIRVRDGFVEILGAPRKPKLGFDSYAGWLGYLMPNDTLFVKRFATYPDRVYNEAAGLTLSVWYPGPKIELEPIGPRERLEPDDEATFTEVWYLLDHPFPGERQSVDLTRLREQVERHTQSSVR